MDGTPRSRRYGKPRFRPQRDRQVTRHGRRSRLPHTEQLSLPEQLSRATCDRTRIRIIELAHCCAELENSQFGLDGRLSPCSQQLRPAEDVNISEHWPTFGNKRRTVVLRPGYKSYAEPLWRE